GYHSKGNLKALAELGVEALIADNAMRRRDERFATQARHQQAPDPLYNKARPKKSATTYSRRTSSTIRLRRAAYVRQGRRSTATAADASPMVMLSCAFAVRSATALH